MNEFDFEPVRGLPEKLPAGERILWQGAPDWRRLAQRAFHVPWVASYFAVLAAWRFAGSLDQGIAAAAGGALAVLPLALIAIGLLCALAWINAKSTVYTVTNRRLVMRFGPALTRAINIPFTIVESAAVKSYADGSGDVSVALKAPTKIAFLHLWPHARPGRLSAPEPTLRAIPSVAVAAKIFADALGTEAPVVEVTAAAPSLEAA